MGIDKRTYKTISLQQAIEKYLNITQLDKKAKISLLLHNWEKIVGKTIAKRTLKVYYRNKVLYIKLKTGIDAIETMYIKKTIQIRIDKFMQNLDIIEKIKIL